MLLKGLFSERVVSGVVQKALVGLGRGIRAILCVQGISRSDVGLLPGTGMKDIWPSIGVCTWKEVFREVANHVHTSS